MVRRPAVNRRSKDAVGSIPAPGAKCWCRSSVAEQEPVRLKEEGSIPSGIATIYTSYMKHGSWGYVFGLGVWNLLGASIVLITVWLVFQHC